MLHETFGESKFKLAMADGIFSKNVMNIIASMQQEPITASLRQYGEDNIHKVLFWAKIYALSIKEYSATYQELAEQKSLSQSILSANKAKEEATKKTIMEIVSYLSNGDGDTSVIASMFGVNQAVDNDAPTSNDKSTTDDTAYAASFATFNQIAGNDKTIDPSEFKNFFQQMQKTQ